MGDPSPMWDGSRDAFEAIRDWTGAGRGPAPVSLHWAGMLGWQLWYRDAVGARKLAHGDRLHVVEGYLAALAECQGEHHVEPHRGCILR